MSYTHAVAVLLTLCCAGQAGAQLIEAQPGARVRIEAPGAVAGRYEGTVLARSADTLVVGGPKLSPIRVPIAHITGLEVSHGTSREDGAWAGVRWGVPATTAVGASLLIAVAADDSCRTCSPLKGSEVVAFMALSALAGAFYGAGIGAMIGRERWERFDLSRSAAITPPRETTVAANPPIPAVVVRGVTAPVGEMQPGSRVKVVAPGAVAGRSEGTVVRATPDTLWISFTGGPPSPVPTSAVSQLEVSRGKSRFAGALRGAIIGAGVGVPLGLSGSPDDKMSETQFFVSEVVGGAVVGGIIGAYVGREQWEHFQIGSASSSLDARPLMRLGLSFQF